MTSAVQRDPNPLSVPAPATSPAARALRSFTSTINHNWATRAGALLVVIYLLFAIFGPVLTGDPLVLSTNRLGSPSGESIFGTDHLGRDMLARSADGARISLLVAVMSVLLGLIIAVPAGMLAGYRGGTMTDEVIMRAVDVILALPLFVLGMFVLGLTGIGPTQIGPIQIPGAWKVVLLIALAATPFFARVARAATLVEVHEDYVDALKVVGVPRRRILFREVIVNVAPPVLVQAFLWIAIAIFAEAALSFLGLGIQPPAPTIGNILFDATAFMLLGAWWYSLFPGMVLLVATVGFNLVGDGLNDLLDPQLRQ